MDLSFLIPSKVRRSVLAYFVEQPDAQPGIRELARELKISPQMVYRELVNLEGWGFLFSSKQGNRRAFRLNRKFILYPPITELFKLYKEENARTYTVNKIFDLKDAVKKFSKIPVPDSYIPDLVAKRSRPRAWDEEKLLFKGAS